jgi:HTH-type transcriptional regulator/antitoxin MqsA
MKEKTFQCHACGSHMVRDVRPDAVAYKGRSVAIQQPGWYCKDCDEILFDADDAAVAESAFIGLKTEVDNILSPSEVQRIRKKLGLSQRQAGALLGGGPRSFQKYESGTDWVTRAMTNLLRLLDHDPKLLGKLSRDPPDSGPSTRRPATPRARRQASAASG